MTPNFHKNAKYIDKYSGHYRRDLGRTNITLKYSLKKLEPDGIPPCPRYFHAACFI